MAASRSGCTRTLASGLWTPLSPGPHPADVKGSGRSVRGPQSTTLAPNLAKPHTAERATRLCSTSPTMTTLRPARSPRCSRAVYRSSNPWVGWAWAPSPALMTDTLSRVRARKCGAPEWGVTHHDGINAHGLQREAGVQQRLTLFHAAGSGGHVDHVGTEDLAGLFEGDAGAGARLVEQGDHHLAAQGGHLLDVARQHLAHGGRVVEDGGDLLRREIIQVQHMTAPVAPGRDRAGH